MATRLYLRGTNANTTGFANGEKSTALPVGTFDDELLSARDLETVKGTVEVSSGSTSLAQTAHQDSYLRKFISDQLTVSAIDANTWTIALAVNETNAQANAFTVCSIYVLTSADTVRGFVYDSDTALGVEYTLAEDGQVMTVTGSAVSGVVSTDRLVFEMWFHAVQGMAAAYGRNIFFDGTTDVTDATTTDAASFIETPQDLFASPNALATPSTVAAIGAVPAPTELAGAITTPVTVAGTGAVPSATVLASAIVTPSVVAAIATVPTPTVIAESPNALVTPATVAAVSAIPAPTLSATAIAAVASVASVTAVPAPIVSGTATTTPATVASLTAVPAPNILANAVAAPGTVGAIAAIPGPVLIGTAITIPATLAAIAAIPVPTVIGEGGGAALVTATTVAALAAIPAPAAIGYFGKPVADPQVPFTGTPGEATLTAVGADAILEPGDG